MSRKRCDRARKILPEAREPPRSRRRGSGSRKRVSCGRTPYYATAFFFFYLLFPHARIHSRILDVCVTTWDANVSETWRTWLEIIIARMRDYLEMQIMSEAYLNLRIVCFRFTRSDIVLFCNTVQLIARTTYITLLKYGVY